MEIIYPHLFFNYENNLYVAFKYTDGINIWKFVNRLQWSDKWR